MHRESTNQPIKQTNLGSRARKQSSKSVFIQYLPGNSDKTKHVLIINATIVSQRYRGTIKY